MLKDKMVIRGVPECTSRADKSSNIITLVTIIKLLLQLYRSIFRTQVYLILEARSNPSQISKMMKHIENHE